MTSIEIFILGASFVINLSIMFLGYLKLVKPQSQAHEKETEILRKIVDSIIKINEKETTNREDHILIKKELDHVKSIISDRSRMSPWINGGADRLTDKVAKEVVNRIRPELDKLK